MRMALTGHRPERLQYTKTFDTQEWRRMIDWLKDQVKQNNVHEAYSGMAEGCDCAYALAIIELKKEGYDVKLHCVLPCDNYSSTLDVYEYIKENADSWTSLSKEFYKGCDNARDQYMVDHSDKIFAIWDGIASGGVYSTIRKAQKKNIDIVYYPKNLL